MNAEEPLSPEALAEIEERCRRATPGPWTSLIGGRDHTRGSSFIMTGPPGARGEDVELSPGMPDADHDFIAHARRDVPRLLAEVRRLRPASGGVRIDVPEYTPEPGLALRWDDGAVIEAVRDDETVVVRANRAGLVSLARHLLTLAQDGVPDGTHVHMDEDAPLEAGSMSVILERRPG